MNAELIAVGSEMLGAGRQDTNGSWLSERLARLGISTAARDIVEDDIDRIASMVRSALGRAEIVILTGGIGPTADDLTREAVALALDRPLERDAEQEERLRERFRTFGRRLGPQQLKPADRPQGADWISNSQGSAPGFLVRLDDRILCVLPGVPSEMKAMFETGLAPALPRVSRIRFARRALKIAGRSEPSVDRRIVDLYDRPDTDITILSGLSGIELHLRVTAEGEATAASKLESLTAEICERFGNDIYGRDDETLPGVVAALMRGAHKTLATAESCTGGLLGGAITAVPGSSAWYRGGFVVYSNELKTQLAGVSRATLEAHGAVSEETARQLARGVRDRCEADIGIGITGIAGPDGGTAEKPVGWVHLALQDEQESLHWQVQLPGGRDEVRSRTVTLALDRLRRRLLQEEASS
jgi:nicotinamide-nucleotide amidase